MRVMFLFLGFYCLLFGVGFDAKAQNQRYIALNGSKACEGDSVQAYSINGDSLWWTVDHATPVLSKTINLKNPHYDKIYARTQTPKTLGPEKLKNPGFGEGNTGFYSEITFESDPNKNRYSRQYSVLYYIYPEPPVGITARNARPGDSLMLFIRNTYGVVWRQNTTVHPGQQYKFSFWYSRLGMGNRWNFHIRINGVVVAEPNLYTPFMDWKEFKVDWIAGLTDTVAQIEIYAPGYYCFFGWPGSDCGHSLVFDDFSFRMFGDVSSGDIIRYDSAKINWTLRPFKDGNIWIEDSLTCLDQAISLEVPGQLTAPIWQDSKGGYSRFATKNQWYSVKAKNQDLCQIEDSVFVHFNPFKHAGIVRKGDSLFAEKGATMYTWWRNDSLLSEKSDAILIRLPGKYRVQMSDNLSCTQSIEYQVLLLGNREIGNGNKNTLMLYPNPAINQVFVSVDGFLDVPMRLSIIGMDGKYVLNRDLNGLIPDSTIEIDVSGIKPGLYNVFLMQDDRIAVSTLTILR